MRYIPVDKESIPYSADIRIEGITYTFEFHYNSEYDFFTVDLSNNGKMLAAGEKISYGVPLFSAYKDELFPEVDIVPSDRSGSAERVGWKELGESVFLYLEE